MSGWPNKPFIYEINTWVWLTDLSRQYNRPVTLADVPEEAVDALGALNVDAVWLMGIWQRSPAGRNSALNYAHEYRPVLPDLTDEDVIGSAYAIGDYTVDVRLGGRDGLASFRHRLQQRGLKLLLDFVPNHVATDHRWISQHPAYFIRANQREFRHHRSMFFATKDAWERTLYVAHGRDPYFPSWIDTAQLNAFSPEYRQAALDTLLDIGRQCDGVRCDMAMLAVNSVFANTWNAYMEEDPPQTEFWAHIIPQVKAEFPDFLFIAEAYWGLESTLQRQGFDYTYDKTLYDRIGDGAVPDIYTHLIASLEYQRRTVRFIENHDEPRAAAVYGIEKSMAAATLVCTLSGATLLHDGQFSGRQIKLPVQIKRQPAEAPNEPLEAFYRALLAETSDPIYQDGEWWLFDVHPAWEGDHSNVHLLAYGWRHPDHDYRLIAINLTGDWAQGVVGVNAWSGITDDDWCLHDVLQETFYYRPGHDMALGLYIELAPYKSQIFRFSRANQEDLSRLCQST
jgi:hypothetical protein